MTEIEEHYTHGHDPVVVTAHAGRTAAEAAAFVLPRLRSGMRILDFGCGPGSITAGLADHVGPEGEVVGIDNSPDVVAAAAAEEERANLEYHVASVYDLPFADASFDAAYGHQILQHLGDPVAALIEVRRVLRPGALVAVRDADYGTMTHFPHYAAIARWLDLYHQVARCNGGEPDAGRRLPGWVRAAGFSDRSVTSSAWTYAEATEKTEWATLWAKRVALPRFRDRAIQLGLADRHEIDEIAAGWKAWANELDGWFSFIHGEVVASKPANGDS